MDCITRLRLVLRDESKADDSRVKAVQGVAGLVKQGGQYQIIIGNDVADTGSMQESGCTVWSCCFVNIAVSSELDRSQPSV